jgi:hypothetical protein
MKIQQIIRVVSAAMVLTAMSGRAQVPAQQVKVKVKASKLEQQMTPDYKPIGVTEKRWRPKQWLELDTELDVDVARDLGGKDGVYPALEIKYFIGVSGKTKEGKPIVLTGSITFENVPASKPGEDAHALAYITPATLKKAIQKDNGGKSDVLAIGLEVHAGGQAIAVYSDKGSPWWIDSNKQPDSTKFEFQGDSVIPKAKTPFAPLWADYDLPTKTQ